ncbi:uncharacterized protein [Misgurnus anguillicaudatus]|uniref:uncharacterized protein isoform X1 n=2 Tax=Misgurnus anguillicaudatus TaxID=75329 RepID=UPI003CCFDC17
MLKKHFLFVCRENDFVEEAQCFSGDGETTETIPVLEASMSSLDIQDDIDEDVFNDIRNSVIDWAVFEDPENITPSEEEETIEDSFSDDSDDEDYMPPLCIRNSGVVTTGIHLEDLEAIGMDETVHDCPDNEPPEPTTLFEKVQIVEEGDIVGEPAAITYLICLKRLAEYLLLPIPLCTAKDPLTSVECRAPGPFRIDCKVRGTAVILQWVCPNEHCVWQWNSQPTFKFGMQAGDFMLATNILLSGNNFAKISLLFQFMNMKIVDRATFFRVQDAYCVDTIREFWHDCRSTIISGLKSKDSVVALADGRMDSPGFCAQFCTYTVMENDTKQIISVVNIDKRETKRISVNMEKEGFIRSFDKLRQEVKLTEICTDAHIQISALFNPSRGKYKDSGVHHTLDMWHGSKSLGKKIQSVGLKKGCSILLHWKRDICNHFWYCCKVNDNYDDFFSMWIGVLHHVTGEHVWALDACQHGPLADEREKEWIPKGSVAHDALSDIVLNGRWLKQVHKYLRFRSTSELESFHNHLLMYASKRNSFTFPVYEARIFLAALDYNSHCSRQPRRRPDGSIQYKKTIQ